jgi:hypothetical protein
VGRSTNVTLTTDWTPVDLDISDVDYNAVNPAGGVNAGLEVVFVNAAGGQQRVYVDDMVWQ